MWWINRRENTAEEEGGRCEGAGEKIFGRERHSYMTGGCDWVRTPSTLHPSLLVMTQEAELEKARVG